MRPFPREAELIKVFVSSTREDLVEYRKAVIDVLLSMDVSVGAMEHFGSKADTAERVCAMKVEKCDVLVGIYAWRYGSRPVPKGPSYTEQEFDVAARAGKKCLCYVVDESTLWTPAFVATGDDAKRLKQFKARVRKGLVVSTFKTPDELAKRVAADFRNLEKEITPPVAISLRNIDWSSVPLAERQEFARLALSAPDTTSAKARDANSVRFVARTEYFGSLIYDRKNADYIPFDQESTTLFRTTATKSLDEVFDFMQGRVQREAFGKFVELCKSIELLDEDGRFSGKFLDGIAPPSGRFSAPIRVHLSCTNACNFRCDHCYASSGSPYAGELTTREIHGFIDELADMGCFTLSLGGGEPLVRADLPEIIRKANSRGVAVTIASNAAAATEQVVATLKDLKIASFKVSMEGASDAVYDAVRGEPGAFQAALRGIENLRTLGVPMVLHRVLMKTNAGDLPGLGALARRLGVARLVVDAVMPVGRAAAHRELTLGEEETMLLWEEAGALQQKGGLEVEMPHMAPFPSRRMLKNFGCECGNVICHVDPLGNVRATGMAQGMATAGNIREKGFREIWGVGGAFAAFRRPCDGSRCLVRQTLVTSP